VDARVNEKGILPERNWRFPLEPSWQACPARYGSSIVSAVDQSGHLPSPASVGALRLSLLAAEQRVQQAREKLQLAEELEARLLAVLEGPDVPRDIPAEPSPARAAVMRVATEVILAAELQAAALLSAAGAQQNGLLQGELSDTAVSTIRGQMSQLAQTEDQLITLGAQALRAMDDERVAVPVDIAAGRLQRRARRRAFALRQGDGTGSSDGAGAGA